MFLTVAVLICFATFGYGQEPEQLPQGAADVDREIYSASAGTAGGILSAGCIAQGGRIVEDSERCNHDEINCGRVLDAKCFCKCCKKPSSGDLGGVLDKLHKYYPADPVPAGP
jgi:hypothetical protein